MKKIQKPALLGSLLVSHIPAFAEDFPWSTGQGLVDTCKKTSSLSKKSSEEDVALAMICSVQFTSWRDAWTFADAYNTNYLNKSGPICVPDAISNITVIEGFIKWAKLNMTSTLKSQPSTAAVYMYMRSAYPCT